VEELSADAFTELRRAAIFDCCKWDPQMGDASAIAAAPILLSDEAWSELEQLAELLAAETISAERELFQRPELHARLALPRSVARVLAGAATDDAPAEIARLMRFDFHWTTSGWRISEANTDVPGALNEASGYPALIAHHYPDATSLGNKAADYAEALAGSMGEGARMALVHATAFTDDRQVMVYLSHALANRGIRCELVSPSQLRWRDGLAFSACEWNSGAFDAIVRFFPAEWLPDLHRRTEWAHFFTASQTPLSNPATALLTQSKRFPLVWDELRTPLPTWRRLLPETRALADCDWRGEDWIIKPALGRVGEDIAMRDIVPTKQWKKIARAAWLRPRHWVAQRRFDAVPMQVGEKSLYPCIGVYTIDGRAAGAYGRVASRPLIDWRAQDTAVMRVPARDGEKLTWA
jgi:glutathionylspermidine synthase